MRALRDVKWQFAPRKRATAAADVDLWVDLDIAASATTAGDGDHDAKLAYQSAVIWPELLHDAAFPIVAASLRLNGTCYVWAASKLCDESHF